MENALYDFRLPIEVYKTADSFVFLILFNSWMKVVCAHFTWSNLYMLPGEIRCWKMHNGTTYSWKLYLSIKEKNLLTKCRCTSDSSISWLGESNNNLQSFEARMSYLWCSCTWNRFNLTTFVVKFLTHVTESVVLTTTGCKNNVILTDTLVWREMMMMMIHWSHNFPFVINISTKHLSNNLTCT